MGNQLTRIVLGIEYEGTLFSGWQRQPDQPTIQGHLETAISQLAGHPVVLHCAGRTDAGVHATGQIVHFDTYAVRPLKAWTHAVNARLPTTIAVQWAKALSFNFHARFSALSRTYRYIVAAQPNRPGFQSNQMAHVKRPLSVPEMNLALSSLIGEHDFSAFRASDCQAKTALRRITQAHLIVDTQHRIYFYFTANAFLHRMVRNIMGVLIEIGLKTKTVMELRHLLTLKYRPSGLPTAPASGLCLIKVHYPTNFHLN